MTTPFNITTITPPRVPFLDERTGLISREWYRFFNNLFTITGEGTGVTPVINGGTGLSTIPTNGQLLIGDGVGYVLNTLTPSSGIGITNGAGLITVANTGVLSNIASSGISVSGATGNVTIANTGVLSAIAGSGISVSGATGDVTFANTGVLSFSGGSTGLTPATATTGAVSLAGTLAVAYGGTGQTTYTDGQLLIGNTTGNTLAKSTLTAGTGISISNGHGSITVTNTSPSSGGTVTSVSVVSANGLAGTVATSTTTPAITLSTTITGLLKGNGTAISAATSGTDYAPATSGTSILYGNGSGGFSNVTIGTGVAFAGGTLSATGSGGTVTSVTGTAPVVSSGGTTPAISLNTGYGDTLNPYASKTANYVLAAPNGSTGVPTFRALVAADIPTLSYVPYTGAASAVDLNAQSLANISHLGVNTTTVPTILARFVGDNNSSSRIAVRGYSSDANSSSMRVTKFRGTYATPQAPQSGDSLGKFELAGYGTTSSDGYPQVSFEGVATENWSAIARGAKTLIKVTPNTTTTQVTAVTIDQDKSVTFATTATATTFIGALTGTASGNVTSVTGTAPVVSSGGTTPAISMAAATTSVNGYLTSTDWTTFNGKQAALVSGTNIKTVNGTTLLGSGDVGTITYAYGGTGQTTVTTGDLLYGSAANTWSKLAVGTTGQILRVVSGAPAWGTDYVGTVTSVGGTGTVNGITLTGTVTSSGNLTLGGTLSGVSLTTQVSGVLPIANGGTNASSASITAFNNITGYSASGATGTTTTNLVFSTSPSITTPTLVGDATLSTGNLVIGTSGKGIDFSITSHPAGMTSELLNDYEEGTFTPTPVSTVGSITSTGTLTGRYTKIGRLVTVQITINIVNNGTGAGALYISSLPFASATNSGGSGISRVTFGMLQVNVDAGSTTPFLMTPVYSYPGGNNTELRCTLSYEI